jgi:hypothetical protein
MPWTVQKDLVVVFDFAVTCDLWPMAYHQC